MRESGGTCGWSGLALFLFMILSFVKNCLRFLSPETAEAKRKAEAGSQRAREILMAELNRTQVDGRPVTHRRLESLMLVTGGGKTETVRLLREIGARPSGRHGMKLWTWR